jgi:phosphomevalonate kinase
VKTLTASAPGKLVLCGEYAVLDGAPAISAAVDRRAVVTIRTADADVVVSRGFRDGRHRFAARDGRVEWRSGDAALPLFEACWAAVPATGEPVDVSLDTTAFHAGDRKLGLGSSAALTVALVAALTTWQGRGRDVGPVAAAAHREFQGGAGSGVDVATSVAGGLIRFTTGGEREPLAWPPGLEAAILWSGISASTRDRLARLERAGSLPSRPALATAADAAAAAWTDGEAGAVIAATREFVVALRAFSDDHGLDVFAAGHAGLAELAEREGLVYKPCGAGGGDIGIVLGDTAERVAGFAETAAAAGFSQLPLELSTPNHSIAGLTVAWTQD